MTAPAPPRLIAPLSTATVTSQRPTLRWALAAGTDGAHVQICRDRACAVEVASFDTDGASAAPSASLPAGVLFWRAFGRSAGATGTEASPTWQMTVGARSAPVDTSWGTTLDVNGDGFADVIVGAFGVNVGTGRAYVYLGSAAGLASSPSTTLEGPDGMDGFFGISVASAGDVNGDGYADVIIGATESSSGYIGRAYVFLGGAAGLASSPITTLTGPDGMDGFFGISVASAGDVNGDGYADVIIGAYGGGDEDTGRAYLYLGGAAGLGLSPATILTGPDGPNGLFGISVAGAGDVNGDGFADVVIGAYFAGSSVNGQAYLYLGGAAGLASSPTTTITGDDETGSHFGASVASAGDVNGDGYADVVVGADEAENDSGRAFLYLGGAAGLASSPNATFDSPDGTGGEFGISVASAGDVNGDGYADVIIGAQRVAMGNGRAYLYLGSTAGLASSSATTVSGPVGANVFFGQSVAGAGDVDGDGLADVIVGAGLANQKTGQAFLYAGNAAGLSAYPTATLTGPDGASGGFGVSVASSGTSSTSTVKTAPRSTPRSSTIAAPHRRA